LGSEDAGGRSIWINGTGEGIGRLLAHVLCSSLARFVSFVKDNLLFSHILLLFFQARGRGLPAAEH
jgi:hypothetical protein